MEFSPLIKGTPDWNEKYNQDIGGLCAEMDAARASGILNAYVHTKNGTAHTLTGEGAIMRFTATAGWAAGDTISVNGLGKKPVTLEGTALPAGAFAQGTQVVAVVDGENLQFLTQSYAGQFDAISTQMSNKVSKTDIIPVTNGGTGKTTQTEAWNAISNMTNGYALPLDLDAITQPGFYGCGGGSTHLPEGAVYGNLLVMPYRLTDRIDPVQLFFAHNTPGRAVDEKWHYRLFRGSYPSPAWSEWTTLAIASSPRRYDIPYSTGFAQWIWNGDIESYYCKTQEGIVIGSVACEKTDKTDIACCAQVAVLPVGFRPKNYSFVPGVFRDVNGSYRALGAMSIGENGSIQCHYGPTGSNKFVAHFCFLAE